MEKPKRLQRTLQEKWAELSPLERELFTKKANNAKLSYLVKMQKYYEDYPAGLLLRHRTMEGLKHPPNSFELFMADARKVLASQTKDQKVLDELLDGVGQL